MEFRDRIKSMRQEKNMTLTELASLFQKSESACRAWELGRTKPDADTLIKLAKYFDCTTDYLLGLSNYKSKEELRVTNIAEESLAKQLEEIPPEWRRRLIIAFSNALDYSMQNTSSMQKDSVFRLGSLLFAYGEMLIASYEMKFSTMEDPAKYLVFIRKYELCMNLIQEHKNSLTNSALDWWEDNTRREKLRELIFGTGERDVNNP